MSDVFHLPALVPAAGGAVVARDGETQRITLDEAKSLFRSGDVIVAHAAFVSGRLKTAPAKPLYDVLELFAFVHPARAHLPSASGVARALGLAGPETAEAQALILVRAVEQLLADLRERKGEHERLRPLAASLARAGWRWGPQILAAIGEAADGKNPLAGYDTWRALPQWEDDAPPPKPSSLPVEMDETRVRLHRLVGETHEARPEQIAYAEAATYA